MAAGRGTRLGAVTADKPKTLVEISGKPIMEHILLSLTPLVKEVFVVTGYLGGNIRKKFGAHFANLKLAYVKQKELKGTADALWQTASFLKEGKFLVLNGDNLYSSKDLAKCLKEELAIGMSLDLPLGKNYEVIKLDRAGFIKAWHPVKPEEINKKVLAISGAYVLDHRIFKYKPAVISNNELGLPQTILKMSKKHPVRGVIMNRWASINFPEDIFKAESKLTAWCKK